jgi:hypothetical protein
MAPDCSSPRLDADQKGVFAIERASIVADTRSFSLFLSWASQTEQRARDGPRATSGGIVYASVFRPGLFDGHTIMVTGGGSGIGRCVAHELASLGAVVVITGRKLEKLQRTAEEIRQDGGNAAGYAFDIRDEDAVRSAVAAILNEHCHIDGLVNNAGGQFPMLAEAIGKKGWESVLATNLTGGFLVSREVYGQFMKSCGGALVNMLANVWDGMPLMCGSMPLRRVTLRRLDSIRMTRPSLVHWSMRRSG